MATPPRQPAPPPKPPTPPQPKPTPQHDPHREERREERRAEREGEESSDPHPDVTTTQEDQLARSAEIEAMGVEAWKAANDERNDADKPAQQHSGAVPGVSPTSKDDPGRGR